MRKEKVFSIVVSSLLMCTLLNLPSAIAVKAQAVEVAVGVKVGDWVKYGNISVTWNSTQLEPAPELVEMNNTLWFRNEVLDVKDELIIFRQTTRFKNETQKTSTFQEDPCTGEGNNTLTFISPGLSADNQLYPCSLVELWINETVTRTYAGFTREVNHLNLTGQSIEGDPPSTLHVSISHYWDKETGVLTERFGLGRYINQTGSQIGYWSRSDRIVETNVWSSEEPTDGQDEDASGFPYAVVGITVIAVVLIGVWALWPRKRKLKKRSRLHARRR